MSLELALQENTAAIHALLAHLQSGLALRQPSPEAVDTNIKALNAEPPQAAPAPKPAAPTPAPKQKAAPAPTPSTAEAAATAPAPKAAPQPDPETKTPAAQESAPDYATTAAAVNALVKARGRQAAVDVLASFKATSLKEVKPEQFAQVITACEKAAQAEAVQ